MASNRKFRRGLAACLTLGLSLLLGSCIDLHLGPPSSSATLAVCPVDQTQSTSSLISAGGGAVSLDGSSVLLSPGAVLDATTIALTLPASQYMEIGVTANGGSFVFQKPIAITIDYSRCSDDVKSKSLTVWQINPDTKALLQSMGGIDNKLTHQITFTTIHFSGYALAY